MAMDGFDCERAIAENQLIQQARGKALAVLQPTPSQLEHGLELHADAVVCDTFGFSPNIWTASAVEELNALCDGAVGASELHFRSCQLRTGAPLYDEEGARHFYTAIKAAGLTGILQPTAEGKNREQDIRRMALFQGLCKVFRSFMVQGMWAEDMLTAKQDGRTCMMFSVNGPPCPGAMIDPDEEFGWLQTWYHMGVRMMHLTYNRRNVVGDGCMETANGGLSQFGRDLVRELNRIGIIVDTAHSGLQTSLEGALASEKPMVASHTVCQALRDHPRGKSDEVIKAIADTGGLVGICNIPHFLAENADLNSLLDHIDHVVKLVGADHAAIGTDLTYAPDAPVPVKGHKNARWTSSWWGGWLPGTTGGSSSDHRDGSLAWTNWPMYTVGLVTRGYSDDDIRKIIGGNTVRVLRDNEPEALVRL